MNWAKDTLDRLNVLRNHQVAAHRASDAAFDEFTECAREILRRLGQRGCVSYFVPEGALGPGTGGGLCCYTLGAARARNGVYWYEDITPDNVSLGMGSGPDVPPEPCELGERCWRAWHELNKRGAAANRIDKELEQAIKIALGFALEGTE